MTPPTSCPTCKNTGRVTRLMAGPCPRCGVRHLRPMRCEDCGGRGTLARPVCAFCYGTRRRTIRNTETGEMVEIECSRCANKKG